MGETPYSDKFESGDYRIKLIRKGYETFDENVHLSASDPNPTFKLQPIYLRNNGFYAGVEAHAPGLLSVNGLIGGYFQNICAEFCFRYPLQAKETAYYTMHLDDGTAAVPQTMTLQTAYQIGGKIGYGIFAGKRMRITPCVGIQYTPLKGTSTDTAVPVQTTYVLSGIGSVKAEYAILPILSLVLEPEYSIPFGKDEFATAFEHVCPAMKTWYGGIGVNAGIHFNF